MKYLPNIPLSLWKRWREIPIETFFMSAQEAKEYGIIDEIIEKRI